MAMNWLKKLFLSGTIAVAAFSSGCKPANFDADWQPKQVEQRIEFWQTSNNYFGSPWDEPFIILHEFAVKTHAQKKPLDSYDIKTIEKAISRISVLYKYELPQILEQRRNELHKKSETTLSEAEVKKRFEANQKMLALIPHIVEWYVKELNQNTGSFFILPAELR